MDAPPIPRLVDLVHVFKGVVVEQCEKRAEELLSDSFLLRRLLRLLFKILQIPEMNDTLKGSPTNFFGTVRQKLFDGKS